LEPSDQGLSQQVSPHGSCSTTNRFPLTSTASTIEVAYQAVYARVLHSALIPVEGLDPASEETVLVGLANELFVAEFVAVEYVLGIGQWTHRKTDRKKQESESERTSLRFRLETPLKTNKHDGCVR